MARIAGRQLCRMLQDRLPNRIAQRDNFGLDPLEQIPVGRVPPGRTARMAGSSPCGASATSPRAHQTAAGDRQCRKRRRSGVALEPLRSRVVRHAPRGRGVRPEHLLIGRLDPRVEKRGGFLHPAATKPVTHPPDVEIGDAQGWDPVEQPIGRLGRRSRSGGRLRG